MNRIAFTAAASTLACGLTACMLSPTDDGRVASTTTTLPFLGFTTEPNAPVQVRAWDFTANAMAPIGVPVRSSLGGFDDIEGGPLFQWSASRVLPARFWRPGPGGGHCAAVGATTTVASGTYNVMTVEEDWGECLADNNSVGGFYANCNSNHNPVAMIYTNAWQPVVVDQARLNLAALVASSQITLTLDNFTPTANAFCSPSNPAGCPEGHAGESHTYQFFQPNASSLAQTGTTPLVFSIVPTRKDPMTIYIDNLSSTSLTFTTAGNRFVLGINFEAAGPEVRTNCIDNIVCGFVGNPTFDLDAPRASLSFGLAVVNGRVRYTDVVATFTTTSPGAEATEMATAIGTAMTEKLTSDAAIRTAIGDALDMIVRQSANLGGLSVDSLAIGGGTLQVGAGCVMD